MSSVEAEHRPPRRPLDRVGAARRVIRDEQQVDAVDRTTDDGSDEGRVDGETALERGTGDSETAATIEAGCEAAAIV